MYNYCFNYYYKLLETISLFANKQSSFKLVIPNVRCMVILWWGLFSDCVIWMDPFLLLSHGRNRHSTSLRTLFPVHHKHQYSCSLFLWNTGLAFTSLKDQLTWNQKSALFILPQSRARNRNLLVVLASFWLITHVLCYFHIDMPKFASQVYLVYKHMYKQFAFFCFSEVCLCHRD